MPKDLPEFLRSNGGRFTVERQIAVLIAGAKHPEKWQRTDTVLEGNELHPPKSQLLYRACPFLLGFKNAVSLLCLQALH